MHFLKTLLTITTIFFLFSCLESGPSVKKKKSFYYKERLYFKPNFIAKNPSPAWHLPLREIKDTIEVISYKSGEFNLKGLLNISNVDSTKRKKGLVYLHGGFALGNADLDDCQPFIENDFIVLAPSYRGENGNPGFFELFMGEVQDAENAVRWLASKEYINPDSVYVFGHSIGGALSLLLSMNDNSKSKLNGSSAGLYLENHLIDLVGKNKMPYDTTDLAEIGLRIPLYYLDRLPIVHKMYIGTEDYYDIFNETVQHFLGTKPSKFELIEVEGDHFSSLSKAMEQFIQEINKGNKHNSQQ